MNLDGAYLHKAVVLILRKRPVMTRVDSGASVSHAGEVDT